MRTLSKSRFRLALECPRKLLFTGRPEYADRNADNDYLQALAQGGFQVGALARTHHPDGIEVATLDPEKALAETGKLLERENVTIFEAAFRFEALFVRTDILVKRGNTVDLIEVKSASWPPSKESLRKEPFFDTRFKNKTRVKELRGYGGRLFDVAFQTHVVRGARPDLVVRPHLRFANKQSVADRDGIHQRFRLRRREDGGPAVEVVEAGDGTLGKELLIDLPVEAAVERVLTKTDFAVLPGLDGGTMTFGALVRELARRYDTRDDTPVPLGGHCKRCQFRATPEEAAQGKRSGFDECWSAAKAGREAVTPVTALWYGRTDDLMRRNRYFLEDLRETDLEPETEDGEDRPMTRKQRQWEQVRLLKTGAKTPTVRRALLEEALDSWKFPLNFIDFETTTVAIPFHRGLRPYEQIAFQFSHHVVDEQGRVAHRTQWLSHERGKFPNFDFVRALREALRHDRGTVLYYYPHELRVLRAVAVQLAEQERGAVADRRELQDFLNDLLEDPIPELPTRGMVDMHRLLTTTYLHPAMGGSNSLKKVLPAILSTSNVLREKYGKPIYGGGAAIPSLNFSTPVAWVTVGPDGRVGDPYQTLEPIGHGAEDDEDEELLFDGEEIAHGGAAMTAFARMQFEEMSVGERERLTRALFRYCELDTLAMVMLYEHWREILDS